MIDEQSEQTAYSALVLERLAAASFCFYARQRLRLLSLGYGFVTIGHLMAKPNFPRKWRHHLDFRIGSYGSIKDLGNQNNS
jgi:hypothetical protein